MMTYGSGETYNPDDWEGRLSAMARYREAIGVGEDEAWANLLRAVDAGGVCHIPLIADMVERRIPISVVDPKSTRKVDAEKPPHLDPGDFEPGTPKPRELWKLRSGSWPRHRRSFVFWIEFFDPT